MIKSISIPLASPRLSPDDIDAVTQVLKTGQLVNGPAVKAFESHLAEFAGVRHAVCLSSGTAALHLGLLALGIGPGDEVVVPAFSYPASANVVELVGARPVFVDSEAGGFNVDPAALENKITSKTKAIIIVHNFGWPVASEKIMAVSIKHGLPIFEDAACALGSRIDGQRCGSLGRLAAFSFHPRKILTTGEGGAITTNDDNIFERAMQLRNHGQAVGTPIDFIHAGFNYRMTDFQAAMGDSQLARFEDTLKSRRSAAAYYDRNLAQIDFLRLIHGRKETQTNYQTYAVYTAGHRRNKLIDYLNANQVGAGIGTYSIPHISYYRKKYGYGEQDFPNALQSFRNLISLPLYDGISHVEQDRVIELIAEFARRDSRNRAGKRQELSTTS